MTSQEIDELGKGDELTKEAIQKLINDESFFYEVFERATPFCAASIEPGQRGEP
jgi:hypothetical protein